MPYTFVPVSATNVTFSADNDDPTTYTLATNKLLFGFLVDKAGSYVVDSLGTRINIGGGYDLDSPAGASYTIDGDDTVVYTVAS